MSYSRKTQSALRTLLAVGVAASAIGGSAADPPIDKPLTASQRDANDKQAYEDMFAPKPAVRAQMTRVRQELWRLGEHPWAGSYYKGDGLGENVTLLLAPQAGFAVCWRGCMGMYAQNYGAVATSPAGLQFDFTLPNNPKRIGFPSKLLPVSRGARHYLIAPEEMKDFCLRINEGLEPRKEAHGFFLLRDKDFKKPVSGMLDVPLEYRKYLLPHPVEAHIVMAGRRRIGERYGSWERTLNVSLDVGSADGILPGMEFRPIAPVLSFGTEVTITAVDGPHHSQASVSQTFKDDPLPRPGWKLSTREINW